MQTIDAAGNVVFWANLDSNGTSDRLVLEVTTKAPGLLVVADTWMPGWTATVDRRAAAILRGNHAQRVIPLPEPGRHEVVLRYEAPGLWRGLAITEMALLGWGAAFLTLIVGKVSFTGVGVRSLSIVTRPFGGQRVGFVSCRHRPDGARP